MILIILFFLLAVGSNDAFAAAVSEQTGPMGLFLNNRLSDKEPQQNIPVETYTLEKDKTLSIPSRQPDHYLIVDPKIAQITEQLPAEIIIKANRLGSTFIILWDATGVRTLRVIVTVPQEEVKLRKQMALQRSKIYLSQKKRTFKFFYDSVYSIFREGKTLSKVHETRKYYDHQLSFSGGTAYGELKGSGFLEYRKDQIMKKSVTTTRDGWIGLFESDLPLLRRYDLIGGEQYQNINYFGWPGARYHGFTLLPSQKRLEEPVKGQMNASFILGEERDGVYLDNPISVRNRKTKDKMAAEKIDYYLWKEGKISLGAFQRWSGPKLEQSKKNWVGEFDLGPRILNFKGEAGVDDREETAMQLGFISESRWFSVEKWWRNINKDYKTVTGPVAGRGNLGLLSRMWVNPLFPITGSNALTLRLLADIYRDRISVNPKREKSYIKVLNPGLDWRLPFNFFLVSSFFYQDRLASSFPYIQKRMDHDLSRNFWFESRWIKSIRPFFTMTLEQYRDAENLPGFNSTRYEFGTGFHVVLFGGFWASAQYLWDRLDELEPAPPPAKTYPVQMTLAGGYSHSIWKLPATINLTVRYTDERQTYNKLHQPFLNEDRIEMIGSLNYRLPNNGYLFLEANLTSIESTIGRPKTAEMSLTGGVRLALDTHFHIPQSGGVDGYFFVDRNGNGVRDQNEPGVAGFEVSLEKGPVTRTNGTGYYELRMKEGVITVKATRNIPDGYFFTTVNEQPLEILPKEISHIDFGIAPQIQVKGRVYLDINENGIFDGEDMPMAGIQTLLDSGQLAVTSGEGLFSILRILPGANRIRVRLESIPAGYKTRTSIERKFEGMPGDIVNFDVIFSAERIVSGAVFVDKNRDGGKGRAENGMEGIVILMEGNKAVTNREGQYSIRNIRPGEHKVEIEKESIPENLQPVIPSHEFKVSAGPFDKKDANFPLQEKKKKGFWG